MKKNYELPVSGTSEPGVKTFMVSVWQKKNISMGDSNSEKLRLTDSTVTRGIAVLHEPLYDLLVSQSNIRSLSQPTFRSAWTRGNNPTLKRSPYNRKLSIPCDRSLYGWEFMKTKTKILFYDVLSGWVSSCQECRSNDRQFFTAILQRKLRRDRMQTNMFHAVAGLDMGVIGHGSVNFH